NKRAAKERFIFPSSILCPPSVFTRHQPANQHSSCHRVSCGRQGWDFARRWTKNLRRDVFCPEQKLRGLSSLMIFGERFNDGVPAAIFREVIGKTLRLIKFFFSSTAVPGKRDNRLSESRTPKLGDRLQPVESRHLDVHQDNIK